MEKLKEGFIFRSEHRSMKHKAINALNMMKELESKFKKEDKLKKIIIDGIIIHTSMLNGDSPMCNYIKTIKDAKFKQSTNIRKVTRIV